MLSTLSCMLLAVPVAGPSLPANGWVNCAKRNHRGDLSVTLTNLNTSETFIAEADVSSNHCQVLTRSLNVGAGDVLRFVVSNSSSTEFNHAVIEAEMCAGGFEQNDTIECRPAGICGDANDDIDVDMTDVMTMRYGIADYPVPGVYVVNCFG